MSYFFKFAASAQKVAAGGNAVPFENCFDAVSASTPPPA